MKTFEQILDISIPGTEFLDVPKEDIIFFDIETTGFSARSTSVYLIGAICFKNNAWVLNQWFADSLQDEAIILASFFEFADDFKTVIHYNGDGFDIPYLCARCIKYNLPYTFEKFNSCDLLKQSRKLNKLLKLDNFKQKTLEKFIGTERLDIYSGGELINIYKKYLDTKDTGLLSLLLLHNREDMTGMTELLMILSYMPVTKGDFLIESVEAVTSAEYDGGESLAAVFSAKLPSYVPKRVSVGNDTFYFTAFNDIARLRVRIYTGELKYFYSDYRDYYYLPDEDTAIHKSVAFYVDKNFRTKAKAANCYSKKTGMFLPQFSEVVNPYFKINYDDRMTYFEFEDGFKGNKDLQKDYISNILRNLF